MASIVLREVKPLYEGGREVGEEEVGRSRKGNVLYCVM